MSLLLDSGISIGSRMVFRLSASSWNVAREVELPSKMQLWFVTLKLLVRLLMKVVLPRPLSPTHRGRHQ
jgi:hypothetical protein